MKFDSILPHVLPSVKGCPDALAVDHIIKAARVFCARTLVWQYDTTILSAAGIARYTLQIEDEQELVRVLLVEVGEQPYSIPSGAEGRRLARRGEGYFCTMVGSQDFVLSPPPGADDLPIVTDIAVKPSFDAVSWPDDFEEYVTDIVHGAVASLCAIPSQDWTDANTAAVQQGLFMGRINTVALKVERGLGRSHQTIKGVYR